MQKMEPQRRFEFALSRVRIGPCCPGKISHANCRHDVQGDN